MSEVKMSEVIISGKNFRDKNNYDRYYYYYYHITQTPTFSHILNRTSPDANIVFKRGRKKANGKGVKKTKREWREGKLEKRRKRGKKRMNRWTMQKHIQKGK